MKNAKRANALIWIGNILLIVGIVAFALQFLILPDLKVSDAQAPITLPKGGQVIDPTDTTALGRLQNPLTPIVSKSSDGAKARGPVKLIGTDRIADDPSADTAYLELPSRKLNVNAYVGEPVRDEAAGQEISELSGWKLKSVTHKSATFTTPEGEKVLELEEITASAPSATTGSTPGGFAQAGTAWDASRYSSKRNAATSTDSQEAWIIDRKEVDWAAANIDSIMNGVAVEPYAGGGLKITSLSEGGFASDRGLRAGDVLKSVNNQPIDSLVKLQEVMKGMSKTASTMSIVVDRSGRMYTLSYTVPRTGR